MGDCPVCNKEIKNKELSAMIDGVEYHFCCKECKANFEAEPRKYVNCCK